jgi:hypothetical protein
VSIFADDAGNTPPYKEPVGGIATPNAGSLDVPASLTDGATNIGGNKATGTGLNVIGAGGSLDA